MQSIKGIQAELVDLEDIKLVTETLEEIAAVNMQRIRNAVLNNRSWNEELHAIFSEVSSAYERKILKLVKKKEGSNNRSILVFLSANTGFYGEVISNTFQKFLTAAKKADTKTDLLIVGQVGKYFMENALPNKQYTFAEFPDDRIDIQKLQEILVLLKPYEQVLVFHTKFKNLLSQRVAQSIVTGAVEPMKSSDTDQASKYIFEPSLEEIVVFFQTEIFASLLEQVFHESRLSKLAARMVFLHGATSNIEERHKKIHLEGQKLRHQITNKKISESSQLARLYLKR
jgi:ATP synthase F1 gamma subunit